jgi:hypothetical protein
MGMRLAARLLLLCSAACSGSCLVVSDPDFRGQEDCIPFFVTAEAEPAVSDKTVLLASTGEVPDFHIPMRSCALTKTYEMRVFLDGVPTRFDQLPPTGEEERPVTVVVDLSTSKPGCHEVEVYLSTRFSAVDQRAAERPSDLAYVLWRFTNDSNAKFTKCGSP